MINLQKGQIKIIRNDKKEIFVDNQYWKLISIEGIDTPPIEIFSQKKGVGVGDIITGSRVGSRDISIECKSVYRSSADIDRRQVLQFFNPLYTYKLYICYNGETRWINADLTALSLKKENIYDEVQFNVVFYCKDGLFKSVDNFNKDIASKKTTFVFPVVFSKTKPVTFSVSEFAKEVKIDNDGEYPTVVKAIMKFSGTVTNPALYKDKHFIKVNRTVNNNDVLVIDLEKARVFLNDTDITQDTDRRSSFVDVELSVGTNTIKYGADNGDNFISCTIYYDKLYGWV